MDFVPRMVHATDLCFQQHDLVQATGTLSSTEPPQVGEALCSIVRRLFFDDADIFALSITRELCRSFSVLVK